MNVRQVQTNLIPYTLSDNCFLIGCKMVQSTVTVEHWVFEVKTKHIFINVERILLRFKYVLILTLIARRVFRRSINSNRQKLLNIVKVLP